MALELQGGNLGNGTAFLVSAGIVYEIIAAACSSPQTTEINAGARASTLMKWVHIGQAQAALFIAAAAYIDRQHRVAILAGGVSAMGIMEASYLHAKTAGLDAAGAPTEQYGPFKAFSLPWGNR